MSYQKKIRNVLKENARLLTMVVEHPHLENVDFINSLYESDKPTADVFEQYDAYCSLVFNMIFTLYNIHVQEAEKLRNEIQTKFGNRDSSPDIYPLLADNKTIFAAMNNHLGFEEYVFDHKLWWTKLLELYSKVYSDDFRNFINWVIEKDEHKNNKD